MSAKIFLACLAAVAFSLASALPTGVDLSVLAPERFKLSVKSDDRLIPQERDMRTLSKLRLYNAAQFNGGALLKENYPENEALGAGALLGSKFGEENVGEYQGHLRHVRSSVRDEAPAPLVLHEVQSQPSPALPPATLLESASQISEDYNSSPPATSNGSRITEQSSSRHPATRTKRDAKAVLKGCAAGAGAFAATNGVATAVAPNPITAVVGAISGAVAVVCGIVERLVSSTWKPMPMIHTSKNNNNFKL